VAEHPGGIHIVGGLNHHYFKTDCIAEDLYGDLWQPPGDLSPVWLRSPEPDVSKPFIACIGAAHTFGRRVKEPFPSLLPIQAANFGLSGGQPASFLHPEWLGLINKATICIVQVPSARASETSQWIPAMNVAGFVAGDIVLKKDLKAPPKFSGTHWNELVEAKNWRVCAKLIQEVQMAYMRDFTQLLLSIRVPTILLWAGECEPDPMQWNCISENAVRWAVYKYPHMVNESMWMALQRLADANVMDITNDQKNYYPTQETHRRIAEKLDPIVRGMLLGA